MSGLTAYELPPESNKGWQAVIYSLGVNAIIATVIFSVFACLRKAKFSRKFYSAKRYFDVPDQKRPPRLPDSFLGWIPAVLRMSEEELLETGGVDGVIYLRALKYGIELLSVVTLICCAAIIPVNIVRGDNLKVEATKFDWDYFAECKQDNTYFEYEVDGVVVRSTVASGEGLGPDGLARDDNGYDCDSVPPYSDFDKLSMANVDPGDDIMWLHAAVFWFVSLYALKLLWRYNHDAVVLRLRYLANVKKGAESNTVLVTDIPGITFGTIVSRAYDMAVGPFSCIIPEGMRAKLKAKVMSMTDAAANLASAAINAPAAQARKADNKVRSYYESAGSEKDGNANTPNSQNWRFLTAEEVTDTQPWARMASALKNGEISELVQEEFESVFPGRVAGTQVVYEQTALEGKVAAYDKLKVQIQDGVDKYTELMAKQKLTEKAEGKLPKAVHEKVEKLEELFTEIADTKAEIISKKQYAPTAFVTFNKRRAQTVASTSLHHHNETVWRTAAAPEPRDLIWPNLKWRAWERSLRTALVWAAFCALCAFYIIPVGIVQSIINVLPDLDGVKVVFDIPFVGDILIGILPALAMLIFLAILPMIIIFMNIKQGMYAKSMVQFGLAHKYWIFQFMVVFVYTIAVGAISTQAQKLAKNPGSIVEVLGNGVPSVGSFFINLIMLKAFMAGPMKMLRIGGIVMFTIFTKLKGGERARARLYQNQPMPYGKSWPFHAIAIMLCATYSVIHPVLLPIALIYFVLQSLAWRYHLAYIAVPQFQSGGRMWPIIFNQIMFGLLISQLVMLGFLGIKEFKAAPVVLPLPIITLLVWRAAHKLFGRPLQVLALRAACDLDARDAEAEANGEAAPLDADAIATLYVTPCFKVTRDAHDAVLAEVKALDGAVHAYKSGEGSGVVDVEVGGDADKRGDLAEKPINQ